MSSEARKGAIYNYINLLLINAVGVVLTPFIIRHLGPSQYGLYTLIGAVSPYLALFDLGLSKTITRYVAHYRAHNDNTDEARFLTTTAYIYLFIVAMLLVCGICLYLNVDNIWGKHFTADELNEVRQMLLLIVATQAIIIPGNAFTAICNGMGKFAFPRGIQPIKYSIRALCVIGLLIYGTKAIALIAVEALLCIGVVIVTFFYVKRNIGRRHIYSPERTAIRPILAYSGWIALYATTCAFQWNIGNIIAGMTCDTTHVGIFGIGILLGSMYGYFAETINRMTLPHASRFIKNSPTGKEITNEMIRVGRLVAIPQIGILGGFAIFGQMFVTLWAGEMYSPAYYIALIMMTAWTLQLSQEYGTSLLEAKGTVRAISIINFVCIFVGVVASYFAAQHRGMESIIYALAGGTILLTIANNVYYHSRLQLNNGLYLKRVFARLLTVTALWIVVYKAIERFCIASPSWWWLVAGAVTYVIVYVFTVYRFVLTQEERKLLFSHAHR